MFIDVHKIDLSDGFVNQFKLETLSCNSEEHILWTPTVMDNNGQHIWSWVSTLRSHPTWIWNNKKWRHIIYIYIFYYMEWGGVKIAYLGRPYPPLGILRSRWLKSTFLPGKNHHFWTSPPPFTAAPKGRRGAAAARRPCRRAAAPHADRANSQRAEQLPGGGIPSWRLYNITFVWF